MFRNLLTQLPAAAVLTIALTACAQNQGPYAPVSTLPKPVTPQNVMGSPDSYIQSAISTLQAQINEADSTAKQRQGTFAGIKENIVKSALVYQQHVANVRARLQVGTTPGNPELVEGLSKAQSALAQMEDRIALLRDFNTTLGRDLSQARFLSEMARSTMNLQGGTEAERNKIHNLRLELDSISEDLATMRSDVNSLSNFQLTQIESHRAELENLSETVGQGQLSQPATAPVAQPVLSSYRTEPTTISDPKPAPVVPVVPVAPASPSPTATSSMAPQAAAQPMSASPEARKALSQKTRLYRTSPGEGVDAQNLLEALRPAVENNPDITFTLAAMTPIGKTRDASAQMSEDARAFVTNVLDTLQAVGVPISRVNVEFHTVPDADEVEVALYQN